MEWDWYAEQKNEELCKFLDMYYEEYSPGELARLDRMKKEE